MGEGNYINIYNGTNVDITYEFVDQDWISEHERSSGKVKAHKYYEGIYVEYTRNHTGHFGFKFKGEGYKEGRIKFVDFNVDKIQQPDMGAFINVNVIYNRSGHINILLVPIDGKQEDHIGG